MIHVVQTIAGLWRGTGGPAESVPGLCRALVTAGVRVSLVTGSGELAPEVERIRSEVDVRLVPLGPYWLGNAGRAFGRELATVAGEADLIHTHGLWLQPNWESARVAKRAGLPYVVSPRGMLSRAALRRSRLRKAAAWALRDGAVCRGAALIHVTSPAEAEQVRARGLAVPIAVIPNGIDARALVAAGASDRIATEQPRREILFLSRIHPIKGIDLLLEAWELASVRADGASLTLAGMGEPKDVERLRQELARRGSGSVRFVGALLGRAKVERLSSARALVLPSFSENYGMVVAEALACGTPVIATTGTPWSAIVDERCGWYVKPEARALAGALTEALACTEAELDEMGSRGRAFVEREHSLESSARKMLAAYEWVLGRGPRPEFVELAAASSQEAARD